MSDSALLLARSKGFYDSVEWKALRRQVRARDGGVCVLCGSTEHPQVDHIKPRHRYPHLALDPDNCQVLCRSCNSSKGARNTPIRTNWLNPRYN